jgi:pimeloyl-ACP methyl ester carboxylesterase
MVPMSDLQIREGFVGFRGHRTWYRVVDEREAAGRLPLVLVNGDPFDECTLAIQEDLHRRLPGSEWTVFQESAHLPHLEEPERFREVVEGFLDRVEGSAP